MSEPVVVANKCACVRCYCCAGRGYGDGGCDDLTMSDTCEGCQGSGISEECRDCEQARWDEQDEEDYRP